MEGRSPRGGEGSGRWSAGPELRSRCGAAPGVDVARGRVGPHRPAPAQAHRLRRRGGAGLPRARAWAVGSPPEVRGSSLRPPWRLLDTPSHFFSYPWSSQYGFRGELFEEKEGDSGNQASPSRAFPHLRAFPFPLLGGHLGSVCAPGPSALPQAVRNSPCARVPPVFTSTCRAPVVLPAFSRDPSPGPLPS